MSDDASLSLPAPLPLTPEVEESLSDMLGKVYQYCRAHLHAPVGRPDVTWNLDLAARAFTVRAAPDAAKEKLHALTFTPYLGATKDDVVGTRLEFRLARGEEDCFVGERVGFTALQNYLTGSEFERTFPHPLPPAIATGEWDRWGHGLTAEIRGRYEKVIYPRVVETMKKLGARRPDRALRVMDLGGGDGQLAELLLDGVPSLGEVLLVDRSAALIDAARPRVARHRGRLRAMRADVTADAFFDAISEPPDVVVLCGVVAQQVMDHGEGLRVMRRCHERLAPGGFALVPSYSPALLAGREYEAMGFTVHNRTLSVIEATPRGRLLQTNDFYIAEKP